LSRRNTPHSALSDQVWDTPEFNFAEYRSAAAHRAMLDREGFRVTGGLAGMLTTMVREWGEGAPVIAIPGEFDALPGLSQHSGQVHHDPIEPGGNGHSCGHNLLGAASMLAATAVKDYLIRHCVPGRVRYYGCQEGGSAKGFMVRAGAFADVDVAISWHPAELTHRHLERLGRVPFDDADRAFAAEIQVTLTEEDIAFSFARSGLKPRKGVALCDLIFPPESGDGSYVGSTDVGTVSWVVPTVQIRGATYAIGTPGHSWQPAAQGKAPAAHKGLAHTATVMLVPRSTSSSTQCSSSAPGRITVSGSTASLSSIPFRTMSDPPLAVTGHN
jgi:metal-dependent amidase/aminoacylase/carboxypeptidase family protein